MPLRRKSQLSSRKNQRDHRAYAVVRLRKKREFTALVKSGQIEPGPGVFERWLAEQALIEDIPMAPSMRASPRVDPRAQRAAAAMAAAAAALLQGGSYDPCLEYEEGEGGGEGGEGEYGEEYGEEGGGEEGGEEEGGEEEGEEGGEGDGSGHPDGRAGSGSSGGEGGGDGAAGSHPDADAAAAAALATAVAAAMGRKAGAPPSRPAAAAAAKRYKGPPSLFAVPAPAMPGPIVPGHMPYMHSVAALAGRKRLRDQAAEAAFLFAERGMRPLYEEGDVMDSKGRRRATSYASVASSSGRGGAGDAGSGWGVPSAPSSASRYPPSAGRSPLRSSIGDDDSVSGSTSARAMELAVHPLDDDGEDDDGSYGGTAAASLLSRYRYAAPPYLEQSPARERGSSRAGDGSSGAGGEAGRRQRAAEEEELAVGTLAGVAGSRDYGNGNSAGSSSAAAHGAPQPPANAFPPPPGLPFSVPPLALPGHQGPSAPGPGPAFHYYFVAPPGPGYPPYPAYAAYPGPPPLPPPPPPRWVGKYGQPDGLGHEEGVGAPDGARGPPPAEPQPPALGGGVRPPSLTVPPLDDRASFGLLRGASSTTAGVLGSPLGAVTAGSASRPPQAGLGDARHPSSATSDGGSTGPAPSPGAASTASAGSFEGSSSSGTDPDIAALRALVGGIATALAGTGAGDAARAFASSLNEVCNVFFTLQVATNSVMAARSAASSGSSSANATGSSSAAAAVPASEEAVSLALAGMGDGTMGGLTPAAGAARALAGGGGGGGGGSLRSPHAPPSIDAASARAGLAAVAAFKAAVCRALDSARRVIGSGGTRTGEGSPVDTGSGALPSPSPREAAAGLAILAAGGGGGGGQADGMASSVAAAAAAGAMAVPAAPAGSSEVAGVGIGASTAGMGAAAKMDGSSSGSGISSVPHVYYVQPYPYPSSALFSHPHGAGTVGPSPMAVLAGGTGAAVAPPPWTPHAISTGNVATGTAGHGAGGGAGTSGLFVSSGPPSPHTLPLAGELGLAFQPVVPAPAADAKTGAAVEAQAATSAQVLA